MYSGLQNTIGNHLYRIILQSFLFSRIVLLISILWLLLWFYDNSKKLALLEMAGRMTFFFAEKNKVEKLYMCIPNVIFLFEKQMW